MKGDASLTRGERERVEIIEKSVLLGRTRGVRGTEGIREKRIEALDPCAMKTKEKRVEETCES